MVLQFYTICISADLAHHTIFGAKVSKGGIRLFTPFILKLPCHVVMSCNDRQQLQYPLDTCLIKYFGTYY